MSQLTKEIFLSGAKFRCTLFDSEAIYNYIQYEGNDYNGAILKKLGSAAAYVDACVFISSINDTGFTVWNTVAGQYVTVNCLYANYQVIEVNEVVNG